MNTEQIKTYITVCEMGSFAKAANQLFLSNVSVLKQINALEKEFEAEFFKRGKKGCEITKEGEIFLEKAKEYMCFYDSIFHAIKNKSDESMTIKIGYDQKVGTDFLNNIIPYMNKEEIEIQLIECSYFNFFEAINNGSIDVAFAAKPNCNCPKNIEFFRQSKQNTLRCMTRIY